ncbi:MAG: GC-type dockerin domain-anchored protein [Phycisphaerales bacterium]
MPVELSTSESAIEQAGAPNPTVGLTTGSSRADLNGDGVVDFFDVVIFVNCYSNLAPCADIDGNGIVDFFDVSLFLSLASTD